ncbi:MULTISPECIES: hypothetical protein [unclassified Mycobacteroides]|uniref:hypothetical protein n=1 Tax=unclassified Mycobacteroides TaxID=2618759 RepID=UPI0007160E80|nr:MULTISPECIES: hypothetical protein [unclassified Mycobacteroides]KRQ23494.1 hypothetical protein AOT87_12485 [Mycobacteroides sp. H003]KRQ40303.1 hypothetical protein AOT92_15115 [Mycobacteroides sp. H101]KRQ47384.1 hypothetical protein AOT88_15805 [Mycobacteroides sp. H063]KRQ84373.1 hypothetical protein AOT93_05575 [Mycobacteroides sp. H110]OHT95600.1 hypothetical protein BKG71_23220 [Mycobacteroides chelonae]
MAAKVVVVEALSMFGEVPSWFGTVGTVGVLVGILLAIGAVWLRHKFATGVVLLGLMCSAAMVLLAYTPGGIDTVH